MLGGKDVRELLCIRVYNCEQLLKGSGGIVRVGEVVSGQIFIRLCILLHYMRGGRFTKVCSEAAIRLNIEDVFPYRGSRGGEVSGLCWNWRGAMTFGIGPQRLGRMLPSGVEVERRNRCGVSAEKASRSQGPRVGAPCTGDISTKRRVSACGPRRAEFAKALAIACGSQEVKGRLWFAPGLP